MISSTQIIHFLIVIDRRDQFWTTVSSALFFQNDYGKQKTWHGRLLVANAFHGFSFMHRIISSCLTLLGYKCQKQRSQLYSPNIHFVFSADKSARKVVRIYLSFKTIYKLLYIICMMQCIFLNSIAALCIQNTWEITLTYNFSDNLFSCAASNDIIQSSKITPLFNRQQVGVTVHLL